MAESTSAAPAASTPQAAPAPAAAEAPRSFKVSIDGAESSIDEATLIRDYQTNQSAQKRFQEAAQTRAQAEEVLKLFKEDPRKAFAKLGVNEKEWAERILNEQMQDDMLTPDQKQMRDYKRQLDQIAEEKRAAAEEAQAAEDTRLQAQYSETLSNQIVNVLQTSGLPKNQTTVRAIATYMRQAYDNGMTNVTPEQVLPYVRADYEAMLRDILGTSDDNQLLTFLGDDMVNKVVKGHLNKVKPNLPAKKPVKNETTAPPVKNKRESTSDYFKRMKRGEV